MPCYSNENNPFPEKCLTGMLDNFGRTSVIDSSVVDTAIGRDIENTLRFASYGGRRVLAN
jgi:hypothetical protein